MIMGKIIRINETELIGLIGRLLEEVHHNLDEVNDEIYEYVKNHPNERFIMSEEDLINFKDQSEQDIDHKPNGLWYAIGSEWIDWVRSEMPEWEYDNVFSLELNDSQIKKISTFEELMDFNEQYKKNYHGFAMIDWRKVSKDYSGIEIAPYIWKARRKLNWYYTWDVASGCIWNRNGIKSIKKIEI